MPICTHLYICIYTSSVNLKLSDLDAVQQQFLLKFSRHTETVFCQEPRFFCGVRRLRQDSPWKINHAAKAFNFKIQSTCDKIGYLVRLHRPMIVKYFNLSELGMRKIWSKIWFQKPSAGTKEHQAEKVR